MYSSAIAQRILIDLKPVVLVQQKIIELTNILSGVEGFDDLYWGNSIEALEQLEIILLWCSPRSLDAFQGSMERDAVDSILQSISDSAPSIHRLRFSPPASPLCSPVVELQLFYSSPESPVTSSFDPMLTFIKSTDGFQGVAAGLAAEEDEGDEIENYFLLIVGWESIEANEKVAKSEGFKNLPKVEETKVTLHHVRFQKAGD